VSTHFQVDTYYDQFKRTSSSQETSQVYISVQGQDRYRLPAARHIGFTHRPGSRTQRQPGPTMDSSCAGVPQCNLWVRPGPVFHTALTTGS